MKSYIGNIPAKYLFIGTMPSVTDELVGKPFTGEYKNLITDLLNAADIYMRECCFTNILFRHYDIAITQNILVNKKDFLDLVETINPGIIIFLSKLAEKYYKKYFTDNTVLTDFDFLLESGGSCSPLFLTNIRRLKEAVNGFNI